MATYTLNYNLSKPESTDTQASLVSAYRDNMDIIDKQMGNKNIAEEYDNTQTYAVDDYVIYNGDFYKCIMAVSSAEDFDSTKWTQTLVVDEMGSGGGGSGGHTIVDSSGTEMTQRSKMQFTGAVNVSDDSVNGQTVVDIEGGGNYYLNTIYSTEEKKVGYYVDGKPLYQKSINIGAVASNNVKVIDITSLNVDSVADYIATAVLTNGWKVPLPQTHTSSFGYQAFCRLSSSTQLAVGVGSSVGISDGYVTLQYTKTTDTPELNPQTGDVIYLPSIYSEEEREIGVWRDGKPLYQKTIHIGALTPTDNTVAHGISNIERVINIKGYSDQGGRWFPLPYVQTQNLIGYQEKVYVDGTNVYVNLLNDDYISDCYVTIQYTKTTDTAGSGIWNGQGGLAHHYSTSEKVVGTWIGGKTLYERTFSISEISVSANSWYEITSIDTTNMEQLISNKCLLSRNGMEWGLLSTQKSNNNKLNVFNSRNGNISLDIIVLQYTKTTD